LLFTAENGANGGVWQATLDFPSKVEDTGSECERSCMAPHKCCIESRGAAANAATEKACETVGGVDGQIIGRGDAVAELRAMATPANGRIWAMR
jgi:hypothetical protein